jgi:hypothetical protein
MHNQFSRDETECALIVWETINEWTLKGGTGFNPEWGMIREGVGSFELRNSSLTLGQWCLSVCNEVITRNGQNFFDGMAYDFEVIPMILEYCIDVETGLPVPLAPLEQLPNPANVAVLIENQITDNRR